MFPVYFLRHYCFILHVIACIPILAQSPQTYFPGDDWRRSTPREQGLDQRQIETFLNELDQGKHLRPISSLTIVKNGFLVVDQAFGDYDIRTPHTLQSVTNSITATLVGIALQKKKIRSIDESVISFFPNYKKIENLDQHKREMTLKHALTMQTGQAWTGESHLSALNSFQGDKMKYVLNYEMEQSPGKKWYYNSGIAILLGGLLENATGVQTEVFAQKELFDPLGITSARWRWGHRGIPHTGGGLFLAPHDMLRIGYLYLRDGKWNGQQVLPPWWVAEATKRHVPHAERMAGVNSVGYGFMWWLLPWDKEERNQNHADIYMAYGHWGQFIFVIPAHDMVIAWTNDRSASYQEELKPISLLYQHIIPAIIK